MLYLWNVNKYELFLSQSPKCAVIFALLAQWVEKVKPLYFVVLFEQLKMKVGPELNTHTGNVAFLLLVDSIQSLKDKQEYFAERHQ